MGRYDGYLILSDIDGTLTVNGKVEPHNLEAIGRFQAEGGRFAVSTGRMHDYLGQLEVRSNAPVITINGTLLVSETGEVLKRLPMENDFEDVLRHIMTNYPTMRAINKVEETFTYQWLDDWKEIMAKNLPVNFRDTTFKFVYVLPNEQTAVDMMHDLTARYGDRYEFDRSWAVGVEMHAKGSGKGACVKLIREMLPDVHTVITVGDYENDLTMIMEGDIGCAVDNAIPSVKAAADRIVPSVSHGAIAYIIDTLIPEIEQQKAGK